SDWPHQAGGGAETASDDPCRLHVRARGDGKRCPSADQPDAAPIRPFAAEKTRAAVDAAVPGRAPAAGQGGSMTDVCRQVRPTFSRPRIDSRFREAETFKPGT